MTDDASDVRLDWQRVQRTGVPEVVLGESKTVDQLASITRLCITEERVIFMTRIDVQKAEHLVKLFGEYIHYHSESRTLFVGPVSLSDARDQCYTSNSQALDSSIQSKPAPGKPAARVAVVSAGTSDSSLVAEIEQTLRYLGVDASCYCDVGVAGLWRLTAIADELNSFPVIIAVAGMEGALFSVLAGLVQAPVVAVPSSVGYGVATGGQVALHSALSSCAPGLAVVNIDNGFGAAALAAKMLKVSSLGTGNVALKHQGKCK